MLAPVRLPTSVASITAGVVTGFLTVFSSVSFASLIFAGELAPFLPQAMGVTLLTAIVVGAWVAAFSSYAGTVAIPQDRVAPILALLAAILVEALGPDVAAETKFLTVIAAIICASILTGTFMLSLGWFRVGGFIRFIPYPVVGGFLAGTGWLLVDGSIRVMLPPPISGGSTTEVFSSLWGDTAWPGWLPGVVMAVLLILILRRWRHFLVLPGMLAVATASCLGLYSLLGHDMESAARLGWTLGPFASQSGLALLPIDAFAKAEWSTLVQHPASFATIAPVSAMSLLLNSAALEIAAGEDMHLNHELRVTGVANLIAGSLGGMVGFHSLSVSSLALRMGARGRSIGLLAALVALGTLLLGTELITFLPRAILGGLLLFLGLSFLMDWVVDGYKRLSTGDYCVVLMILATVAMFGFLEGVAIGLLGAICLFVVNYSRVNVVKQLTNSVERQSNVDRPPRHVRVLKSKGTQVHILRLQGYLFFGTANRLFTDLRQRCERRKDSDRLEFVVMDFERVAGMDSSAALSFAKIAQLADKHFFDVLFCGLSEAHLQQLNSGEIRILDLPSVRRYPDLDHALEWCEDQLLSDQTIGRTAGGLGTLQYQMEDVAKGVIDTRQLMQYLDRQELEAGIELMSQGEIADDMYFIESGQVTIQLVLEDGVRRRIRKMGAGTVTGELGLYLGGPRNAAVVADVKSVVYRLTRANLERMRTDEPELAAAFHHYMVRLLAERLVQTNRALRALIE